jgi:hypothetical protein
VAGILHHRVLLLTSIRTANVSLGAGLHEDIGRAKAALPAAFVRLGLATLLPLVFARVPEQAAGIAAMPVTLFDDGSVEIVCSRCGMTAPKTIE